MDDAENNLRAGIVVPRSVMFTVVGSLILALPSMIASGAWYMSRQDGRAETLAEAVTTARAELTHEQDVQDKALRDTTIEISKMHTDMLALLNTVDQRVTKLETQVLFVIQDEREKRDIFEAQVRYLADALRGPPRK